jgi:hypothetical protein
VKRAAVLLLALVLAMSVAPVALAETFTAPAHYITTSASNADVVDPSLVSANAANTYPPYLTSVTIAYAGIQPGDIVSVIWLDTNLNPIGEDTVTASGQTLNAPTSTTWGAKLHLRTGSGTGTRWVWFAEATNSIGNVTVFEAPDTSGGTEPPPDDGGGTEPPPDDGGGTEPPPDT